MQRTRSLVVIAALALLVACGQQQAPPTAGDETVVAGAAAPWQVVEETALDAAQLTQLETGRAAQQALAQQLMSKLTEAMDSGGPQAAIDVCAVEALRLGYEHAAVSGVNLGRTSQRLRNPLNQAPEWTAEVVAGNTAEPVILVGPEGQLGSLTPIVLKAECEVCHGPVESIDEDLFARINDTYPEDQATGFKAGDLRGWFWFEAPAAG